MEFDRCRVIHHDCYNYHTSIRTGTRKLGSSKTYTQTWDLEWSNVYAPTDTHYYVDNVEILNQHIQAMATGKFPSLEDCGWVPHHEIFAEYFMLYSICTLLCYWVLVVISLRLVVKVQAGWVRITRSLYILT